jgi:hypothetical protein
VVADADFHHPPVARGAQVQPVVGGGRGVLGRVVDQVEEDLLDSGRVGNDGRISGGGNVQVELEAGLAGRGRPAGAATPQ